ncbi:MAG: DivIVA domain-containing protein [Streptosporangiaceae bacterium]
MEWFEDQQRRLTPDQVQTVTFPMSHLGRRGFEEEAVRAFLHLVHAELVHLIRRDDIMREAQQHADLLLEEAQSRARDAAGAALEVTSPPLTERERQAAHAELAYLRTYSDVYRAHLRAYTEGVLQSIEDWERKEAASLKEVAPGRDLPSGPAGSAGSAGLPSGPADRSLGPPRRRSIG